MYNFVVREYQGLKEIRYYSSPIKTDEDRIKPRKKRVKSERKRLALVSENPFTGEQIIEWLEDDPNEERNLRCLYDSLSRTRRAIYDLCMSNKWDYFLTFTFRKEVVDRYNYEDCSKKMMIWVNNVKKLFAPNLKYVIVPEQHKDGAWHFHGLLADVGDLSFIDSGLTDSKGRTIYNLFEYKFGFTTATKVTDSLATCLYVQKYITKGLCEKLMNKKRYWCSRNLEML